MACGYNLAHSDPQWQNGDYSAQPQGLRVAEEMFYFMGSNPVLRQTQMPTLARSDAVINATIKEAVRSISDMVGITKALNDIGASIRILDMNIDTTTPTGTLMLNIFSGVAQFERDMMLERQRVGIAAAKERDKYPPLEQRTYKGAKPTARAKADSVKALLATGKTKEQVAKDLNIGVASVYRILKIA
jgi:DNA invertase Pin-like site-specific DNA recombinase